MNNQKPVNIYWSCKGNKNSSRYELIEWVNEILCTNLGEVEQMRSGAAYCQLFELLFPGNIPLKKVKFRTNDVCQYRHNFDLLQTGFEKLRIPKLIPENKLVLGSYQHNFEFLQWFYMLFQKNCNNETLQDYDPILARNGCPLDLCSIDDCNHRPPFLQNDLVDTMSYETITSTIETDLNATVDVNEVKRTPSYETTSPNKAKVEFDTRTYSISSDEHIDKCVENDCELVFDSSFDSRTYTIADSDASELEITEIPDIAIKKISYRVPDITNGIPRSFGSDDIIKSPHVLNTALPDNFLALPDALRTEVSRSARRDIVNRKCLPKSTTATACETTNIEEICREPTLSNILIPYKSLNRKKAKKLFNWKTFLSVMDRSLCEQIEAIKQSIPHTMKIAPAYSITNEERRKETNNLLALGMFESDKFHEAIRERNLLFLEFNKLFKHFRSCAINSAVPEFEEVLRLIFAEDKGPYLPRELEEFQIKQ
ncbi:uncharacterized protein LOC119671637 [Teleopsis dalmanni]|uniref:uncharacterized protein LOC119671637 n=1 Tax=Teleopsis dalmanni TaxID=139649 RepID=UPI0018CE38EB|nr:uncharacterized protein LOC119671637 [Teleopsis dalmanni]XP_037938298.1 uncharacterized protein LOC119671637 [Teleopsis dalmanni]XP_037938299.1 uncharacterized protein LOC119671637 [Teleopsis dalmanni]